MAIRKIIVKKNCLLNLRMSALETLTHYKRLSVVWGIKDAQVTVSYMCTYPHSQQLMNERDNKTFWTYLTEAIFGNNVFTQSGNVQLACFVGELDFDCDRSGEWHRKTLWPKRINHKKCVFTTYQSSLGALRWTAVTVFSNLSRIFTFFHLQLHEIITHMHLCLESICVA